MNRSLLTSRGVAHEHTLNPSCQISSIYFYGLNHRGINSHNYQMESKNNDEGLLCEGGKRPGDYGPVNLWKDGKENPSRIEESGIESPSGLSSTSCNRCDSFIWKYKKMFKYEKLLDRVKENEHENNIFSRNYEGVDHVAYLLLLGKTNDARDTKLLEELSNMREPASNVRNDSSVWLKRRTHAYLEGRHFTLQRQDVSIDLNGFIGASTEWVPFSSWNQEQSKSDKIEKLQFITSSKTSKSGFSTFIFTI